MKFGFKDNKPEGPHLATVVDDSGELLPIIPGMAMFIIMDVDNPQPIPFVLHKVETNKLTFRMKTSDGGINLYEFKCTKRIAANAAAVNTHCKSQN